MNKGFGAIKVRLRGPIFSRGFERREKSRVHEMMFIWARGEEAD